MEKDTGFNRDQESPRESRLEYELMADKTERIQ